MNRKRYLIVVNCLLVAGLAVGLTGAFVNDKTAQIILAILAATFFLSAAMQIIVYKSRPKAYDDKPGMKEN
jgi:hypothetical protein